MPKVLNLICGLLVIFTITACQSEKTTVKTETKPKEEVQVTTEDTTTTDQPNISTSVFQYATSVDVTDSRDITKHIDVVVKRDKDTAEGLAMQQLVTQTYDFLQQTDIKGANTVTIGLMIGEIRVAQFTVDLKKFTPGDNFIKSVMNASKIDKMDNEIKAFGKSAGYW
jgi:hypothetical protein